MTICNPLNVSYRFTVEGWSKQACREAADPSVVRYRGEYWLFASKSGGYWHSRTLGDWQFVPTAALPTEDYAPDVEVIDDALVVTASNRDQGVSPVFRSTRPAEDQWKKVADVPEHHDPTLFQDDDGRVYRHWGCSNSEPLYACELDRTTLQPIGPTVETYFGDMERFGWEVRGEDHTISEKAPHIEGPWLSKHNGKYYLQYAAPGTQYNIYADAVLVGTSPLGPFKVQAHNPMSYMPGGFIPGAGHGSTFQDEFGNWWHISTMRVSVRHKFERRLGLWPAGFDDDGVMFCNTAFGDYPMNLPTGKWDPWTDPFPGWMLLSYRCDAQAGASLPEHGPELAMDENVQTYWAAEHIDDAWLCVDLGESCTIQGIQTNFTEHQADLHGREGDATYFQYCIDASTDGYAWTTIIDKSDSRDDLPHDYVSLDDPIEARHLRLRILHVPSGAPAVSGFRVFGLGHGDAPAAPQALRAVRGDDRRRADLHWDAMDGATGYLIRWGVAPQKCYNSYLVHEQTSLQLRCLDREQSYHVSVQAFGPNGVSPKSNLVGPI